MNAPHADTPRRLNLKDASLFTDKAYVAGEWVSAPDGKTMSIHDPFDGTLLAKVPDLGVEVLRRAIDAAHVAQKEWARKTVKERAQILRRWYDLVIANADDLALILTSEQGKPLAEAKGEIVANAAYLEWFGEEAKRIDGDVIPSPRGDQRLLVLKQPLGVCAAITPWNFPNGMITRKVAPALAAGCTMVLKPSELTPFSALALAALAEEAGVPAGVLNVVTGAPEPIGRVKPRHTLDAGAARHSPEEMPVSVVYGDLLDQDVEVIVNAWNRNLIPWWLLLPQGISGAIKRRGGVAPFRELRKSGVLPLGGAAVTGAGRLPFKAIIHVAGIGHLWTSSEASARP